ncbi:hypothetical protein J2Y68_001946 [Paenarthrobacter nitroguajacolicus]|nr:hypothetical protein [Paenarthrobacter nitroguajacolicus]
MFADPTLTLKSGSRLAWYLGTPSVDPDDWMEAVIRKVMAASGAGYVLTEGSGAGGFAALRLATRFAHAVAIPRTPQTDVFRHASPDPLRETLEAAWPGYGYDELMHGYAHRFRIMDLYTDPKWNRGNLVHCVHNAGDTEHTENHLAPMLDEFGVSQHAVKALDGRVVISRPYAGDGQIGIPAHHWAGDADLALRRLKSERPLQGAAVVEGMFTKPSRAPQPRASLAAARRRTLSWHVPAYF